MNCPICKKPVPPDGAFAPFCSDRCRLLDLGNWASEKYRIASAEPRQEEPEERDEEH